MPNSIYEASEHELIKKKIGRIHLEELLVDFREYYGWECKIRDLTGKFAGMKRVGKMSFILLMMDLNYPTKRIYLVPMGKDTIISLTRPESWGERA